MMLNPKKSFISWLILLPYYAIRRLIGVLRKYFFKIIWYTVVLGSIGLVLVYAPNYLYHIFGFWVIVYVLLASYVWWDLDVHE